MLFNAELPFKYDAGNEGAFLNNISDYNWPGYALPGGDTLLLILSLDASGPAPTVGGPVSGSDFGSPNSEGERRAGVQGKSNYS